MAEAAAPEKLLTRYSIWWSEDEGKTAQRMPGSFPARSSDEALRIARDDLGLASGEEHWYAAVSENSMKWRVSKVRTTFSDAAPTDEPEPEVTEEATEDPPTLPV